jgi:hypothetical protein
MVLPQFSLRMALGMMAVLGFVSLLISRGLQGSTWAMGITIALAALAFAFVAYAAVFGLVFVASKLMSRRSPPSRVISASAASVVAMPLGQLRDNSNLGPPAGGSLGT